MNALNRRLPLLHGFVGLMLLIQAITHLRGAMPALLIPSATAEAYGYAFGQSLGISLQLAAGVGLMVLSARALLAKSDKRTQRSESAL